MLCSQRGLVPDYISPDDLVFVFKSCANDKQLVHYDNFKQAIVKICAISQNKAKMLEDTQNLNATKKGIKDKEPSLIEGQKKKREEKLKKLRLQFDEEQKAKEAATSKAPKPQPKQDSQNKDTELTKDKKIDSKNKDTDPKTDKKKDSKNKDTVPKTDKKKEQLFSDLKEDFKK